MKKSIRVEYYGILREHCKRTQETLFTHADTPAALFEELRSNGRIAFNMTSFCVAVNDEMGSWNMNLSEGDKVVFIPPVAGG